MGINELCEALGHEPIDGECQRCGEEVTEDEPNPAVGTFTK